MNPLSSTNPSTPHKPLSELYILSHGNLGLSWLMHQGRNLAFHNYKNEPAIYNLSISNPSKGNTITLRQGDPKKESSTIISQATETSTAGEYHIAGPMGEEKFEKSGKECISGLYQRLYVHQNYHLMRKKIRTRSARFNGFGRQE
tara:strand:- start:719 stop:1153 length:435 start_codon:yes stop_codon:yes gene_type:complete